MNSISDYSSIYRAAATATGHTIAARVPTASPSIDADPTDTVDLSARALTTLARAKLEKSAADRLATQVGQHANSPASNADSDGSLFDQLAGRASSQSDRTWDITAAIEDPAGFAIAQQAAHKQSDGTIASWSTSATDVFVSLDTPEAIDHWYQTQGSQMLVSVKAFPSSFPGGLADAIENRTLTFASAKDIPGLNYHNWYSFQGGETGTGGASGASFNSQNAIFSDPNVHAQLFSGGIVAFWPSSSAA